MLNIMVDTETVGLKPDSAVAQIGAVLFKDNFQIVDKYCINIDVDQQLEVGSSYDDEAIDWWILHELENAVLYDSVFSNPKDMDDAYTDWLEWLKYYTPKNNIGFRFWSNHLLFDVPILNKFMSYYDDNLKHYIKYNKFEDFATVRNMVKRHTVGFKQLESKIDMGMDSSSHNALYDAVWQTKSLELAYKTMGIQL